ncbi:rho GTPase-activating protein 19 isoform X2 [Periplaneta americana]|uniref:rho GTPase-activating protein 19 isoform X2 n=1 Tax=Periplaneta americana TaxID=6978 RepID=UPI0037E9A79A
MENISDVALAERLRREDPEQFHTLVRMHLSFVLDLNTDDCEYSSEKAKSRLQKWGLMPFSKKGKCLAKGVMEGAPLTQEGICQVFQLIEFLSKDQNISQEGIFRRSGKMTRQQELKQMLNQGCPLNLEDSHFSVHDCASVLKNFLAELPESLLTDAHYPAYCQIAEMCGGQSSEGRLLRALQLLFLLLPVENRVLLKDILQLLHLAASHEERNKMSADSLATLFTPHLLCPRKLSPEALHVNSQTMSGVVAFMIQQGTALFNIPPKLATDIRVYLAERDRRKHSPKKELNESILDGTAANTVFSFVDRERTALAHVTNPTETALAQLYAHIQSLPESSKKKKLIKQFNKENGQGTPQQNKHLRSKSLGDSIKKHIFNKSAKRQKNFGLGCQFNVSRSLSQETLSKSGACITLFQKSLEDDSHTDQLLLQLRCSMLNSTSRKRASSSTSSEASCDGSAPKAACCSEDPAPPPCSPTSSTPRDHGTSTRPETMMTPRCRKPVVLVSGSNLCHLASVGAWSTNQKQHRLRDSCSPAKEAEGKEEVGSSGEEAAKHSSSSANTSYQVDLENEITATTSGDSGSLTSTFRSYLLNRSVLTASPVDLSFSSRTGDFDTSESDEDKILDKESLSSSLLYCLDGNTPPADEDKMLCEVKSTVVALISNSTQFSQSPIHETSL